MEDFLGFPLLYFLVTTSGFHFRKFLEVLLHFDSFLKTLHYKRTSIIIQAWKKMEEWKRFVPAEY